MSVVGRKTVFFGLDSFSYTVAIGVVFQVDLIWSYIIALVPAFAFCFVCVYCKSNTQLYLAAILR